MRIGQKMILFVGIAVLTACAKPADKPVEEPSKTPLATDKTAVEEKTTEPVEIVLWHSYRENEKIALGQVVENFNRTHSDVSIRLLNVPYDAFVDKITIATPRGQGPDLFIFAHNVIGEWVDHSHILEPISSRIGNDTLARFIPATVKALVYKQSLYGLPLAFKSLALFINPDLVATPPETAEELVATAKAATNPAEGRYGLAYEAGLLYFNAPFIHGFGGEILDAGGQPTINGEGVAKALDFVKGLVTSKTMPTGLNSAMVTSLFNEGKAAMAISGPWFLGEIAKDRAYNVVLLPKMTPDSRAKPYLGSEAVFLSSFSKHKDEAVKVMEFLTSDESAMIRWQVGRQTVANQTVYEKEEVKADRVVSLFRVQAENSVLMPSRPEMQVLWSTVDMAINQVVFGDSKTSEALESAQAKALSDISKMKK